MKRMTVVTVAFNSESTIEDTIKSVQAQTGVDVEHVIVDGGSTDGTMGIVMKYKDVLGSILSEKDGGIYDAMNKGLALAKGEFIGFLNSDDYFASVDSLSKIAMALQKNSADCAYGNIVFIDELRRPSRLVSGRWFKPSRLSFGLMPPHPAFYARTDIIRDVGGFDDSYKIAGDFDLMIRLFARAGFDAVYVDELTTIMRLGGVSTENMAATQLTSREIHETLAKYNVKTSKARVRLRYILRIKEIIRGRLLRLTNAKFPAL